MYPRQPPPPKSDAASSVAGHRSGGKREQIAKLLINKFRNKFTVSLSHEAALDQKICDHVNSMVKTDEQLGEKQLVQMSRALSKIVEQHRRLKPVHQSDMNNDDDLKSNASKYDGRSYNTQ